jgi:hypothetical protein
MFKEAAMADIFFSGRLPRMDKADPHVHIEISIAEE